MLADRHNKDTLRVDPEQVLLAHDCNMSRSTVNRHLEDLEGAGLLVRVPRVNPATQKQMPTFYVLAIDFAKPPNIEFAVSDYETRIAEVQSGNIEGSRVPNSDTGAVSQKTQIPCPKNGDSRVSKSDTNPVREPGREPCAAAQTGFDFEEFVSRFWSAYPRPGNRKKTEDRLRCLICDEGVDADAVLSGAQAYAAEQTGNALRYVAYSENWLAARRWEQFAVPGGGAGRGARRGRGAGPGVDGAVDPGGACMGRAACFGGGGAGSGGPGSGHGGRMPGVGGGAMSRVHADLARNGQVFGDVTVTVDPVVGDCVVHVPHPGPGAPVMRSLRFHDLDELRGAWQVQDRLAATDPVAGDIARALHFAGQRIRAHHRVHQKGGQGT